jgi:hypothetical protein
MSHPRNVGWGEIGLDYHYDNSPRGIQREVFTRQLRHAVRQGKPVTVHTREAEEDAERILKAEVPKDHKVLYQHNSTILRCAVRTVFDDMLTAPSFHSPTAPTKKKLSADTCSLFHRLSRFRTALIGLLPESVHRHYWYASFPSLTRIPSL